MIRKLFIWISLVCCVFPEIYSETISRELVRIGMENVAMTESEGHRYVTWEDPVYRGTYRGLFEALKVVLSDEGPAQTTSLLVQEEKIPRLDVLIRKEIIEGFRDGTLSLMEVMQELEISSNTDNSARYLRGIKRENRSTGKVDFVLYPQISLTNAWFDKLYGTIINIAPAVEIGLWKGASFTGQVIFPIWNNMEGQMDYIRAGMLVLRQEVRFPHNVFATLSVGNFNSDRMGADLSLLYRLDNDRWAFGLNGGLTGSSTFYGGKWELSKWKRASGSVWIRYTEPSCQLDFEMRGVRCVYGDYGVRADCTRHFGEVSVGLYAMYTGGEVNGGFHFAIPLPRKKRAKRSAFRVRLPEYFDLEYEAQSGNEYAEKRLGRFYETRPDENHSRGYYNPDYIRKQLIGLTR